MERQILRAKQRSLKTYVTGCGCPVVSSLPANDCEAKLLLE